MDNSLVSVIDINGAVLATLRVASRRLVAAPLNAVSNLHGAIMSRINDSRVNIPGEQP